MTFNQICLLDDILRPEFIKSRNFIYTVIESPITQTCNIVYPDTSFYPARRGLNSFFSHKKFIELCGTTQWEKVYNKIPAIAGNYLLDHIQNNSLIISYEPPPWLINLLENNKVKYIAIRISPIKFARDLYLTIQTNLEHAHERISEFNVSQEEVQLEAGLIRAAAQQLEIDQKNKKLIENGVLFLGQTRNDASIINKNGEFIRINNYAEEIKEITRGRKVIYKPHPYDKSFAKEEINILERIIQKKIHIIKDNIYKLLASNISFEIVSISSGTCQEATFFKKKSNILYQPICNPWSTAPKVSHIKFIDFCSPIFWGTLLNCDCSSLKIKYAHRYPDNLMRSFHDVWWGYSEFLIENDKFWMHAFSGGLRKIVNSKIAALRKIIIKSLTY